jgi:hypothetical protein
MFGRIKSDSNGATSINWELHFLKNIFSVMGMAFAMRFYF